ncbi:hypothetical protein [Sphingopyxis yananensis]|uniref:hypothetical protein n=1 Tax=Sphingopyxis yananensis TaxID=2886687 RepID=UPI001D12712F|nr:hypothetical protein [Sphingopyxis yananensis]MCC2602767.1 hypothetical protein [Sphingopyxis yananensis]
MNYNNPAATHDYTAETDAAPSGSMNVDTQQARFGELTRGDLRQLVAAMVD